MVLISVSSSSHVSVWHEGKAHDFRNHGLVANNQIDTGTGRGKFLFDIAHGDGPAERWRKASRRHASDGTALGHDDRSLTRRGAAFRQNADTAARWAIP